MKTRKPDRKIHYQIRQGDVLIERIGGEPIAGDDARKSKRVILAEGEVTGHCHEVIGNQVSLVRPKLPVKDYEYFMQVGRDAIIEHPDHRPAIPIKVGRYKSIPQMQYTPKAIVRDRD